MRARCTAGLLLLADTGLYRSAPPGPRLHLLRKVTVNAFAASAAVHHYAVKHGAKTSKKVKGKKAQGKEQERDAEALPILPATFVAAPCGSNAASLDAAALLQTSATFGTEVPGDDVQVFATAEQELQQMAGPKGRGLTPSVLPPAGLLQLLHTAAPAVGYPHDTDLRRNWAHDWAVTAQLWVSSRTDRDTAHVACVSSDDALCHCTALHCALQTVQHLRSKHGLRLGQPPPPLPDGVNYLASHLFLYDLCESTDPAASVESVEASLARLRVAGAVVHAVPLVLEAGQAADPNLVSHSDGLMLQPRDGWWLTPLSPRLKYDGVIMRRKGCVDAASDVLVGAGLLDPPSPVTVVWPDNRLSPAHYTDAHLDRVVRSPLYDAALSVGLSCPVSVASRYKTMQRFKYVVDKWQHDRFGRRGSSTGQASPQSVSVDGNGEGEEGGALDETAQLLAELGVADSGPAEEAGSVFTQEDKEALLKAASPVRDGRLGELVDEGLVEAPSSRGVEADVASSFGTRTQKEITETSQLLPLHPTRGFVTDDGTLESRIPILWAREFVAPHLIAAQGRGIIMARAVQRLRALDAGEGPTATVSRERVFLSSTATASVTAKLVDLLRGCGDGSSHVAYLMSQSLTVQDDLVLGQLRVRDPHWSLTDSDRAQLTTLVDSTPPQSHRVALRAEVGALVPTRPPRNFAALIARLKVNGDWRGARVDPVATRHVDATAEIARWFHEAERPQLVAAVGTGARISRLSKEFLLGETLPERPVSYINRLREENQSALHGGEKGATGNGGAVAAEVERGGWFGPEGAAIQDAWATLLSMHLVGVPDGDTQSLNRELTALTTAEWLHLYFLVENPTLRIALHRLMLHTGTAAIPDALAESHVAALEDPVTATLPSLIAGLIHTRLPHHSLTPLALKETLLVKRAVFTLCHGCSTATAAAERTRLQTIVVEHLITAGGAWRALPEIVRRSWFSPAHALSGEALYAALRRDETRYDREKEERRAAKREAARGDKEAHSARPAAAISDTQRGGFGGDSASIRTRALELARAATAGSIDEDAAEGVQGPAEVTKEDAADTTVSERADSVEVSPESLRAVLQNTPPLEDAAELEAEVSSAQLMAEWTALPEATKRAYRLAGRRPTRCLPSARFAFMMLGDTGKGALEAWRHLSADERARWEPPRAHSGFATTSYGIFSQAYRQLNPTAPQEEISAAFRELPPHKRAELEEQGRHRRAVERQSVAAEFVQRYCFEKETAHLRVRIRRDVLFALFCTLFGGPSAPRMDGLLLGQNGTGHHAGLVSSETDAFPDAFSDAYPDTFLEDFSDGFPDTPDTL